ncbi:MAG: hypothetical protein R2762_16330 [Bryobacteraceae bacterium]
MSTLREVELGELYGKRREVAAGLQESEDIVTEGAFHLNNERRRRLLRSAEGE